jgi:site-specific recombinase XerD
MLNPQSPPPFRELEPTSIMAAPWVSLGTLAPQHIPPRATRPFQFASLERLDAEVARAMQYGLAVEGLSVQTIRWWRISYAQLRRFLAEGDRAFRLLRGEPDAQAQVLEEWIAALRSRGAQHGTVRGYWCATVSLFDRLTKIHGVWNPLRQFRRPRAPQPIPRALLKPEAERLLAHLSHARSKPFLATRNLAIVGCMVLAGLRRSEVLHLNLQDAQAAARTLRIVRGKGRHGGKTRTAYVPKQLAQMLRTYEEEREAAGFAIAEPYFLSEHTGKRLSAGAIARLFETIRKQTGLRVSPHMLRHTYVTLLRQSGVEDRVTMDLAGHSSLAMTQRYSAVFSGEHQQAADRLNLDI